MYFAALFFGAALVIGTVRAQAGAYQQCGGQSWTGTTSCVSGYTCTLVNQYYSQCTPGSAGGGDPANTPTPTPTTAVVATTGPSVTISGAQSTNSAAGKQIRTVQDPVYHLYIQLVDGKPVLGPEATSGYFVYGSTVALVMADGSKLYLNVDNSATTSYKPMTFGTTATTTTWKMSGDTFLVGNQQNFLVCPISGSKNWNFYLQTGNDSPGGGCANYITIHLPCLC